MPPPEDARADRLKKVLAHMEKEIPLCETMAPAVSATPVAWHMHHSLLVINQVCASAKASNPANYKWKFSAIKTLVYSLNRIPRGRVKAPRSVRPDAIIGKEALQQEFKAAYENITSLQTLDPNAFFTHPFFGDLNRKPTIRFLLIHTQHHLRIIDDIIRHSVAG
jgi:hypothetical protein